VVNPVIQALAAIPRCRDELNAKDDEIAAALRRVEGALVALGVGIAAEIVYATADGRRVLSFDKWNGTWRLGVGREHDNTDDVPLLDAPRAVRAEVFVEDPETGRSPVERLLVELSEQLVLVARARDRLLTVAARLTGVLDDAVAELPS